MDILVELDVPETDKLLDILWLIANGKSLEDYTGSVLQRSLCESLRRKIFNADREQRPS